MKHWFNRGRRREQLLVTAFVLLGALVWLLSAAGRLRTQWENWHATRTDLATQRLWLDRHKEIEAAAGDAVRNLDPARTFDATRLVSTGR